MSTTQHTPGPWTVTTWQIGDCHIKPLWFPTEREAEVKANARIIAAAPDLLESLHNLASAAARIVEDDDKPTIEHMCELNRCRRAAVAVISKAKGQ